jgi:hypothetical protein
VKPGASLTGAIVIVKAAAPLVSLPPLSVPPSSTARTVTMATPLASAAGAYVSFPSGATTGWTANSAGLSMPTLKLTFCDDSLPGPAEMPVAQPATDCAPASSSTL